jgi:hypothetical protein
MRIELMHKLLDLSSYIFEELNSFEESLELQTGSISEAISLCSSFKNKHNVLPTGFILINYEIDKNFIINITSMKTYYINGKLIPIEEIPNIVVSSLSKPYKHFIYINENFFVPFNNETDVNLKINI